MVKTMLDSARAAVRPALLASVITLAVSACDEGITDMDGVAVEPKRDLEKELVEDVEQAFKDLASTLEIPESEVHSVVTQLQTIGQADLDAAIKGVARKLRADLAQILAQ